MKDAVRDGLRLVTKRRINSALVVLLQHTIALEYPILAYIDVSHDIVNLPGPIIRIDDVIKPTTCGAQPTRHPQDKARYTSNVHASTEKKITCRKYAWLETYH
ncbi:hypothetical protein J6590_077124 [Homalodisca vitripennis]|nr:hypothetical protein J6590_077124 [Homalodisca vitripennis]